MSVAVPHNRISLSSPPNLSGFAAFENKNDRVEWHQPVDKWQFLVLSHSGVLSCNGRVVPFGSRAALVLPPRARCRIDRSGASAYEHVFCWFSVSEGTEDSVAMPLVSDVSVVFDAWEKQWNKAFDRIQFSRTGVRAWLWDVLWYLAAGQEKIRTNLYVEEAEKIIHDRIQKKIVILELASELQISHSQLVRLFREEHGTTIQEYIRVQRTVRACRLLTETTQPIKAIASAVGVPDLQQFSRMIRDATGVSPRMLRVERREFQVHGTANPREGIRQEL